MGSTSFSNKVVGIFSDNMSANAALDDLNANGFDRSDISVLARDYDESDRDDNVVTNSSTTAYPDTDTYKSGVTGSDVYPRASLDPTLRGEVAANTIVDDYPAGNIGSNRFGSPDNRSTMGKVGDGARSIDDKLTGTDLLNNNTMTTDNRSALEVADDNLTGTHRNVVVDSDSGVDSHRGFDNTHDVAEKDPKAMVKGATAGGALGLIAGLGVLLIPGIGPVLAAGPLAAAITAAAGGAAIGATAGTLIGVLNDEGIPSDRSDFYNRHFNKGNIIIMIHTDEGGAVKARQILVKHNPETIDTF